MKHNRLQSPGLRSGLCLLLAFLSALALLTPIKVPGWEETVSMAGGSTNRILTTIAKFRLLLEDRGMLGLFVLAALFLLFCWFFQKRGAGEFSFLPSAAVLALIFAILMPVGASIQKFNGLEFIVENRFQMMYSILLVAGWWALFYPCIRVLFAYLDNWLAQTPKEHLAPSKFRRVQELLLDKHPFVIPMLVMLLCWLPYWIAFFPGSVSVDTFLQFNYFFGIAPWSDHHPVLSSLLYGLLLYIGRMLANDSVGIFLCAIYQHILFSSSCSYSLSSMKRWNIPLKVRFLTLLFYSFCPVIAVWPSEIGKDTTYYALALFFGTLLINIIQKIKNRDIAVNTRFIILLVGIVASLIRHNGVYVCAGALLLLAFYSKSLKHRVSCVIMALVIMMGSSFISGAIVDFLDAAEGSKREALSIPFQQTARYVKEHGDEVTTEERAVIDAVLQYDVLPEKYNPTLSDPVKGTYRGHNAALAEYFSVWAQMFFKHPITYIEATLCNTYSYYYPGGDSSSLFHHYIADSPAYNTGFFDIKYELDTAGMQNALKVLPSLVKRIPGIGLLLRPATYTWILLLVCAYAIHRSKKYIILGTTPAMLNILVCIASPVNGFFRYFLPTLLLTPVIVGWMLSEMKAGGHFPETTKQGETR